MNFKTKGISYFLFSLSRVALSSSVIASVSQHHGYKGEGVYKESAVPASRGHFEIIGAGGIAKLNAANSELGVTSSESDRLVQTNSSDWDTAAGQLGIGYVYNFHQAHYSKKYANKVHWFTAIEPQLNVYQLSTNSIKGNVLRYDSASFNQLTYDIPIHSTRLMLDAALTVATWQRLSLYAKAGIGNAWNRASYSDKTNADADCAEQQVSLNSNTNSSFAWEAGAGVNLALTNRFGLSFEYLYTDLGTVKTSSHGSTGTIATPVVSAPSFNLRSQTALLGLHIAI